MEPTNANAERSQHGDVLTAISDGLVALLKEFYGRGPMRAKSYYENDLVVCVLRGGSPAWSKRCSRAVAASRHPPAHGIPGPDARPIEAVVERATGQRVVGFMSGNQQDPDIMCEVFILASSDLIDEDELPERRAESTR